MAVAKLALAIVAPTLDGLGGEKGASVFLACYDLDRVGDARSCDGCRVV